MAPNSNEPLEELQELTMLVMLLRLMVVLRNDNGDATMYTYSSDSSAPSRDSQALTILEKDFTPLDGLSAILVQDSEVFSTCYRTAGTRIDVLVIDDDVDFGLTTCLDERHHVEDSNRPREAKTHSLLPIDMVAMPNAEDSTEIDDEHFTLVLPGEDLWPRILADPYCIDRIPNRRQDHIATVESYLNFYMTNPENRSDYSAKFNFYLTSACCKKMYRRITAWTALGFIYKLVYAEQIQHWIDLYAWNNAPWQHQRGPGDTSLARYITSTKYLLRMLNKAPNYAVTQQSLDVFIRAVESNDRPIYTKETARQFHLFVVAALVNLGYSLKQLKQSYSNPKVKRRELNNALLLAEVLTRLFFYISSSSAFETHINVCTNDGSSISNLAPVFNQQTYYRDFGQMHGILSGESRATTLPSSLRGLLNLVGPGSRKLSDSDPTADSAEWLSETAAEAAEEGAQPVFHSLGNPDAAFSLRTFLNWIRSFVFQFYAKRGLEQHCHLLYMECHRQGIPSPPVRVTHLASKRKKYRVLSWERFKQVVKHAMQVEGNEANLKKFLDDLPDRVSEITNFGVASNVIHDFQGITKDTLTLLIVGTHAEAALAILALYPHSDDNIIKKPDGSNTDVCKNLLPSPISVSKLCCPVCWELLKLLQNNSPVTDLEGHPVLDIRGYHQTVYKVALPKGVPPEIRGQMEDIFRTLLRQEIKELINPRRKHRSTPSTQSGSSMKTASSSLDGNPDGPSNSWRNDQIAQMLD